MHNCATSIKLIDSHLYFLQMPRDARAMTALLFTALFQELVKSTDDILPSSLLKVVFAQEAIVVGGNKIFMHGPREEVGNELTFVLFVDLVATCLEVEWG